MLFALLAGEGSRPSDGGVVCAGNIEMLGGAAAGASEQYSALAWKGIGDHNTWTL